MTNQIQKHMTNGCTCALLFKSLNTPEKVMLVSKMLHAKLKFNLLLTPNYNETSIITKGDYYFWVVFFNF